jgi:hypothetical protein
MKFRKKPVVIEALQWTDNSSEMAAFMGSALVNHDRSLEITTLEGQMIGSLGDWIIKGVKGEFYPCKPDIFALTYEEV